MQQGRWVSYIYRYREDVRCENAGFVKVQKSYCNNSELARIQVGLKLYKKRPCKCMVYILYKCEDSYSATYLTDIYIRKEERDTILTHLELPWRNSLGANVDICSYDGLFFYCDDGEQLVAMWKNGSIRPSTIEVVHTAAEREIEKEIKDGRSEAVAGLEEKTILDMSEADEYDGYEACKRMLEEFPRLPLLADSAYKECVRISPQDIGRLPIKNWRLGENSFLIHGYYHYKYIMMGKVLYDGRECMVIGVPGVFNNKEKYLANMFGFTTFIPAKRTRTLMGNFGYWVFEISR